MTAEKTTLVLDIEVYRNYLLVCFKSIASGKVRHYEMFNDSTWERQAVLDILRQYRIVTFNGLNYDMPLLTYALRGATNEQIKAASNHIIEGGLRGWQFEQQYDLKVPPGIDHIDLCETVPGVAISLKLYGARLHSKRLQDLPYEHNATIDEAMRQQLITYCVNDLDTTIDLWHKATDPEDNIIETRERLGNEFGIDLRSKSDAQIAEAVIRARVSQLKGEPVYRQEVMPGTSYRYRPPAFLRFNHPLLREKFAEICAAEFVVKADGKIAMPKALDGAKLQIGQSVYSLGVGGLHSTEKCAGHVATQGVLLRDRDVVSFYPALILQCGLFPRNMGEHFQRVYEDVFKRRIAAKKVGHKSVAQTLKIVLNGTFGKLGSRWSVLYSPDLLIQVTVTGQLVLLMMIERMEAAGIPVVSANTDGIVMACPAEREADMLAIVAQWERETGLETEETRYRGLFSRDVNNYLALKDDGKVKTKGALVEPGIMKNPDNVIVSRAVCALLNQGTPLAQTILGCRDVRQFLTVQRVTGGAQMPQSQRWIDHWNSPEPGLWTMEHAGRSFKEKRKSRPAPLQVTDQADYLGRVVRWYRSTRSSNHIEYVKNGNKVGGSDHAMPLMELPDSLPDDIDYDWYLAEANDLLREIGAMR